MLRTFCSTAHAAVALMYSCTDACKCMIGGQTLGLRRKSNETTALNHRCQPHTLRYDAAMSSPRGRSDLKKLVGAAQYGEFLGLILGVR